MTCISHGFTCIPHPDPPSHHPLHLIPLGLPSAPGPSPCLMHPAWAGDLFHPRYAKQKKRHWCTEQLSVFFKIFFETSSLIYALLRSMLFNFYLFKDFPVVFLIMISTLIPLHWENTLCMISIILNLLKLVLWLEYCLFWYMFHECLKRMYIIHLNQF